MFEESFRGIADLVLPGTSYLERDGTTVNLEGRLQRQRRAVLAPVPGRARVDREARRALRRRALAARLGRLRRDLRAAASAASRFGEVGEHAALPPRAAARAAGAAAAPTPRHRRRACGSSPTGRSSPAPPSSARRSCSSSARPREVQLSRGGRATRAGSATAQTVTVSSNGTSVELRARIARDLAAGHRAHRAASTPATCTPTVEVTA